MLFAFRLSLLSLALNLSLIVSLLSPVRSASGALNAAQTPAEAEVRAVVERYYVLYAAKDFDGWLRLWSAQAPELEANKKATTELFANSASITLTSFAIRRIGLAGPKAWVRVELDVQVIEAQTGKAKAGYGKDAAHVGLHQGRRWLESCARACDLRCLG